MVISEIGHEFMIHADVILIVCVCSCSVGALTALVHADNGSKHLPCWSPLGNDHCVGEYKIPEIIDIRVTAGRETERGEVPWQVALYRQRVVKTVHDSFELFCGGSIITHQHILTAAHCFTNSKSYSYKAIVGDYDRTEREIDEQEFQFAEDNIYSHPNYNFNTDENDIAIIKLNGTIQFNKYAQPITLSPRSLEYKDHLYCTITGWGKTKDDVHADFPKKLQAAQVWTFQYEECRKEASYGNRIKDTMFCAGALWGEDSCQGDSGGPIVCEIADQNNPNLIFSVQYGIVSFGIGCGQIDKPGVYTRLSKFQDWINQTLIDPHHQVEDLRSGNQVVGK